VHGNSQYRFVAVELFPSDPSHIMNHDTLKLRERSPS
jgi:hypothetical protein